MANLIEGLLPPRTLLAETSPFVLLCERLDQGSLAQLPPAKVQVPLKGVDELPYPPNNTVYPSTGS